MKKIRRNALTQTPSPQASYVNPNSSSTTLDPLNPTTIATFKISGPNNPSPCKIRVNVKQDVSGIITLSSAQAMEEIPQVEEEETKEDKTEKKEGEEGKEGETPKEGEVSFDGRPEVKCTTIPLPRFNAPSNSLALLACSATGGQGSPQEEVQEDLAFFLH